MIVLPIVLVSALAPLPAAARQQPEATYTVVCTFTNPDYAGECEAREEVPRSLRPRAACERILSCLNDVRCTKTYCSATTIRRGWTLVAGRAEEPPR